MRANGRISMMVVLVALVPLAAHADKKDELFKQAQNAATSGNPVEASRLYCQVADMDANYPQAKMMCTIMKKEAEKELARNEDRFKAGVDAFNKADFDDAKQKFRNVKIGPRVAEAQQYLNSRIPQAEKDKESQAADAVQNQKFDQAEQAYSRNDFGAAKSLFSQVTGRRGSDAQAMLNKIKQYEQAMAEGDTLARAKNYRGALNSYTEAQKLKSDGPGDPGGKISQMQTAMASVERPSPTPTPVATAQPPPPPQKPVVVATAIKEPTFQVDTAKLLREAEQARKKGNIGAARGKYLAVLAADKNNSQAQAALDDLAREAAKQPVETQQQQTAGSEADIMLAKGIGEFYTGNFDDAEFDIKYYMRVNGSKTALGNFYLGVLKLTRYYLNGEQPGDRKLMSDAEIAFKAAKKTPGFRAPERMVSPKILKVYNDLTP